MDTEHHNLASPGAGADSSSPPRLIAPGAGFFMGVNMESLGWIKLHRKMVDWEWYTSANTMRVFIHLLLTANHAEQKWKGTTVKRGQVICGRHSLAKSLKISEQQIKTALRCLKSTSEITIQSTNRYSIITLCNYDTYQSRENPINQPINQPANQQSTSNQPATNHKQECKEGKNIEREGDAAIPTLDEIKAHGAFVGATDEQCQAFFDHNQGNNLWLNQHGRMVDVRTKLRRWVINDQQRKPVKPRQQQLIPDHTKGF